MCTTAHSQVAARMMPLKPSQWIPPLVKAPAGLPAPSEAPALLWPPRGDDKMWPQGQIQHLCEPKIGFTFLKGCKKRRRKRLSDRWKWPTGPNLFTARPLQSASWPLASKVLCQLPALISPHSWLQPPRPHPCPSNTLPPLCGSHSHCPSACPPPPQ